MKSHVDAIAWFLAPILLYDCIASHRISVNCISQSTHIFSLLLILSVAPDLTNTIGNSSSSTERSSTTRKIHLPTNINSICPMPRHLHPPGALLPISLRIVNLHLVENTRLSFLVPFTTHYVYLMADGTC
jgi:hypothetical protein